MKQDPYGIGTYPFDTQEELDAYNQRKDQWDDEEAAGYYAGGPIDPTMSDEYQAGQETRMEVDAEKPWWRFW